MFTCLAPYHPRDHHCEDRDRETSSHAPADWCESCWAAWFWGWEPHRIGLGLIHHRGLPPYGCPGAERHWAHKHPRKVIPELYKAGHTQAEIAALCNLSQQHVCRILQGLVGPIRTKFAKILVDRCKTPQLDTLYIGRDNKSLPGWARRRLRKRAKRSRVQQRQWQAVRFNLTDIAEWQERGCATKEQIEALEYLR